MPREGRASAGIAVQLPLPPPIDVEIREQLNGPVKLVRNERIRSMPGLGLEVRNEGVTVAAGLVIRVDAEPYGMNSLVAYGPKGLGPGESKMNSVGMAGLPDQSKRPQVYIDFVLFVDGSSWGDDTLGRSKDLREFVEGRNLAMTRLEQLLAGRSDAEIKQALNVFGASSFSAPNLPTGRPAREIDFSARGYESIVMILRRMPRSVELGQDLARELELMARTPSK